MMKTIIVKNQAEWDALPEKFAEETAVHVYSDPQVPLVIKRTPQKAAVSITEKSLVDVGGSATIRGVGGSATIQDVGGSATIRDVGGSATIRDAKENATIIMRSDDSKVEAWHFVTVICQDCKPTIKRHGTGVTVVRKKTFKHSIKSFCGMYGKGTKPLTLYKSVHPDTLCDHYTGQIRYEGEVTCPDWDPNPERQCGGGLHLSPTPYDALRYHDGKVLVCEVARKDIVVYPTDVTKVRCRKVKVVGEWGKAL